MRGFTLVEGLVAVLITFIVATGIASASYLFWYIQQAKHTSDLPRSGSKLSYRGVQGW